MSPTARTSSTASLLAAATSFALLTACAVMPAPEQGVVDAGTLSEDEGIVFGVLTPRYYDSGGRQLSGKAVPEIDYELYFGVAENLGVKRAFSGFADSIPGNTREPQTFFAMKLPAGEYSLFKLHRPFSGTIGVIPTDVRFTVAPNTTTYIGSLQIDFRATRGLFGEKRVGEKVALNVVDDATNATRVYKERNPDAAQAIATSLMKPRKP